MKDTINNLRKIKLNTGFKKDAELDVAIVGAGLSGLYSAYRLRTGTTHGKAQPAYSDQQGWVEGAFCEAEKILRDHFSFNLPEWL